MFLASLAAVSTDAAEQGEKAKEEERQEERRQRRDSSTSRLAAGGQASAARLTGRLQVEFTAADEDQQEQQEEVVVGAVTQSSTAIEQISQAGAENRPTSAITDLMLLLDDMPEGTAEAAAVWCNDVGVESLAELREAEMEEELIAALPLKAAKAKILRKRLKTTGNA